MLARAKQIDEEVAAHRGAAYAGEADPYKKPRVESDDDDDEDDDDADDLAAVPDGDDEGTRSDSA